ncbi:MAG TPA: hypothetical protein V6C78_04640 [Crinalium sp.]|jgi:hypothetical protein
MTASKPNILELAKQGDARAIAALMNRYLQPKGITATAALEDSCLQIWLESEQIPNQPTLVEFVQKGMSNLGVETIRTVKLYGVQTGEPSPVWKEDIDLSPSLNVLEPVASAQETSASPERLEAIQASQAYSEIHTGSTPEVDVAQPEAEIPDQPSPAPAGTQGVTAMQGINWKLIIGLIIIALISFLSVAIVGKFLLEPKRQQSQPEPTSTSEPVTQPSTEPSASSTPSPSTDATSGNPLEQARALGLSAAVNTQTANTKAEWDKVIADWQEAIRLLGQVPNGDANYATAQQKISEYQRNLDYAKRKAGEAQ